LPRIHADRSGDEAYSAKPPRLVGVSTPTRRYHVPSAIRRSSLRIEPEEARELVAQGALLVDVRRLDDEQFRLDGAVRIPPDEMPARLPDLPRDRPIVLACT
jgi:hypothetical protein